MGAIVKLKITLFSLGCIIIFATVIYVLISINIQLKDANQKLTNQVNEQLIINKDYQSRLQSLHQLDIKHTEDLISAKTEIDKLRDDVKSGVKRVYVRAECSKIGTHTAASLDDGRPAILARDAEEDYFRLNKQLETMEKQFLGLRDYINTQCLTSNH